jgi:alkyldihydroxyacetonephosphate synthase
MGIVTEAWMRVRPVPSHRASASVHFASWDDAVAAVREIAQSGLYPSNARLLDAREALIHEVATDGSSVLVLGFEAHGHDLLPWVSGALAITGARGGVVGTGPTYATGGERTHDVERGGAEALWRRAFFEAPYLQSALVAMGLVVDTFETACTWSAFPALHAAVVRAVKAALKEACGGGLVSCRFTHVYPDGPAPYYTFMGMGRPGEQIRQWSIVKEAACRALIENGATITHHHAVGRVHRAGWREERPPLFGKVLEAAKRELDPAGILNRGVLI